MNKVKHLHFIADNVRTALSPCSGRPRLPAQTPVDAVSEFAQ